MTRSWLLLALVTIAVASAIWLGPASVHIVSWPPAGPVRVALLAPLSRLWRALGLTLVVMSVSAGLGRSRDRATLSAVGRTLAPMALLLLWVVPFLPWLPDRAPLLLALAGPVRWVIAVGAIAGTLAARGRPVGGGNRWFPKPPGRWTVFAISLAIYLGFGFLSAEATGPGADEPHYLIITQSLLADHDLAIENNYARGDYRQYFGGGLRPDYLQRGRHDVIYSIHAPGLPALLLPAFAAAGYRGAVAMLCLIGALTALAVFDLAEALAGRLAAWLTWLSVCVTVPFIPHAWLIFPEMPAALIVAWAALWLWRPLPDRLWTWRGLAVAALPWLHTKFIVLLVVLTALLVARLWPRVRLAAAFVAPIATSVLLWLYSFYLLYGVFDPQVPYGGFARLYVLSANIPRSLLGILFDQKFGLLFYSPVYWLAAAGCWLMVRRVELRWFVAALALGAGALVISNARLYMWWGGSSAPARFLVPILPLLAPMIAVAIRDLRGIVGRGVLAAVLSASLAVTFSGIVAPARQLLFSDPHGYSRLIETIQAGAPLTASLPTFTDENWRAPIALMWPWAEAAVAGLIVLTVLGSILGRRVRPAGRITTAGATAGAIPELHHARPGYRGRVPLATFWTVTPAIVTFGLVGSIASGRPRTADRAAIVAQGRLSLMDAYDGARLSGFDYSSGTILDERQVINASALVVSRLPGIPVDDPHRLEGPFELPPGRYESRVWFEGSRPREGEALLAGRGQLILARTPGPLTNPAVLVMELPVPTVIWVGLSSQEVARSVRRVDVAPQYLVPRSERPNMDVHAIEPIANRPGAYIVYADDNTYPEGGVFWTHDTHRGDVYVVPAGATTLLLTLYPGPVADRVSLRVSERRFEVNLTRDETRQVEVPLPGGLPLVPVSIQASGTFRPSAVDPRSNDERWLGCQVRIELR